MNIHGSTLRQRRVLKTTALIVGTALVAALAGCSAEAGDGEVVTITLEGPNQWNSNGASFGPAWEDLVAAFEAEEPGINVETIVLPLDSFSQTISTQLSAGTAPELVFKQAPHKPYMVYPLDEELTQPNPYVEGNEAWIDVFNPQFYGYEVANITNEEGNIEFIPFNLVQTGVFFNEDAFADAGVELPLETFEDLIDAFGKLKDAGYTPFAMDNSDNGLRYTYVTIFNMLMSKYYDELNIYKPDGSDGAAAALVPKSWVGGIERGQVSAVTTPEVAAVQEILKEFYDEGVSENWSGITPTSSTVVGLQEFASGEAAMAWGNSFAGTDLADVDFAVGSFPFPTITKETTPLASGQEAQWGAGAGGTSYMIPSTVKGEKLEAAIKFLQYVSAPEKVQPWLDATGALPALADAELPTAVSGLLDGAWGESVKMGFWVSGPAGTTAQNIYGGYLLGSKSLEEHLAELQVVWEQVADEKIRDNGWTF